MVTSRYQSHVKASGPIVIEVWLDYICPFSKKQFLKLYNEVIPTVESTPAFKDRFQWVFRHQVQPWHAQGVWLHEAAIAVGLLNPGIFWEFSKRLFEVSENYYDYGARDKTRTQIIGELADLAVEAGVPKADVLTAIEISGNSGETRITPDIKYYVKLGRQNGIHVSPSVLINGVIASDISSSWDSDQWLEKLRETDRLVATGL